MSDTRQRLERQAAWQEGRAALTWPEKIRMAEAVREWAAELSRTRRAIATTLPGPRRPISGQPSAVGGGKSPHLKGT